MITPGSTRRDGFTLAEVAVTIVIVGLSLTLCMQSLLNAKTTAVHTRNLKLARELGIQTLGQIESGLFREEIQSGYYGSYAEEGHEEFSFEIRLGDDSFLEYQDYDDQGPFHDTFAARREREYEAERMSDEEDEEEIEEPYEKVRVRVSFPPVGEYTAYLDLERWMPWDQVYGSEEEEELEVGP